jgi:hypothetical protein
MATSSIPTFKSALKTRLLADANFTAIQVSRGSPYPDRDREELVIIGDANGENMEPVGFSTTAREEEYSIEMVVSVLKSPLEKFETLEDRAFVIAGYIENSINTWRSEASPFGGINGWALIGQMSSREVLGADSEAKKIVSREASVTFPIMVTARI